MSEKVSAAEAGPPRWRAGPQPRINASQREERVHHFL
jgi:hypothetical protein